MAEDSQEVAPGMGQELDRTDEIGLIRTGGVLVLDGPRETVERLIAGDPALRVAQRVEPSSAAASGALAALAPAMGLIGAGGGPAVFQLDAAGQAMFDSGSLAAAGDGFFRLFGQTSTGTISGHGAIKQVTMAPQQLATAQLAVAVVALTAAIKEVQEAVERVEDKVDLLRDILDAERDGEVLGANRSLRRRAERVGFDGAMSDTDWHAIDDIGIAVEQQVERLRSFIRKRLAAAEDEGRKLAGRLEAVRHARDVAETLALLVVAQDSLFLFQQMRVLRIKATQPEFAESAIEEAKTLLQEHSKEDAELVERLRTLVDERVEVEALEVLRFRAATEIARLAPEVDEILAWFASQRGLSYQPIVVPALPGSADVVNEVKDRGVALAAGGRRTVGELAGKVRDRGRREPVPELEQGHAPKALSVGDDDAAPDEPDKEPSADSQHEGGRLSRIRSSATGRSRRSGRSAEEGEPEGQQVSEEAED